MVLRKTAWLVVWMFLLAFATVANSQSAKKSTESPKPPTPKKEWRVVDGFRSAKFGMDEKQVMRAIAKDFKIARSKVERMVTPVGKTTALIIHTPGLLPGGGATDIVYLLGHKSKKLMRVNIDWGAGVGKNFNPKEVAAVAHMLRKFFVQKRYQKKLFTVNGKLNDSLMFVFRGRDEKGRMILLQLKSPKPKEGEDKKEALKKVSLVLSYILNPDKPDIFKAKGK